ncbi:MAG: helix-turn-helix domain-containing protein [Pirellulales bacterium]
MPMTATKRKALVAAGWSVGDAADFLGLSDEERQLVEMRLALALAVRLQRLAGGLSQKQLGTRMGTTQPRIAKIEVAASDVSLDQLVRAYTAAGGRIECLPQRTAGDAGGRLRVRIAPAKAAQPE